MTIRPRHGLKAYLYVYPRIEYSGWVSVAGQMRCEKDKRHMGMGIFHAHVRRTVICLPSRTNERYPTASRFTCMQPREDTYIEDPSEVYLVQSE